MKFTFDISTEEMEHLCTIVPKIWKNLPEDVRQQLLDSGAKFIPTIIATAMQHSPQM